MEPVPVLEALKNVERVRSVAAHFSDPKGKLRSVPLAEIVTRSRRFAGGLFRRKIRPGDPVILVMTDPEAAITAILGCMIAGCPPSPVYPPQNMRAVPAF